MDQQKTESEPTTSNVITIVLTDKHSLMSRPEDKEAQDCSDSPSMPDKYANLRGEFSCLLLAIPNIWDGRLGRKSTLRHCVTLDLSRIRVIHLVPYQAGLKARHFEKSEMGKMLAMYVIEPCKTE